MKDFLKKIIISIIIFAVVFVVSVVGVGFFNDGTFNFKFQNFATGALIASFILACIFLWYLLKLMDGKGGKKKNKAEDKVHDTKGNEVSQFFDRDFTSDEELEKNPDFNPNTLETIRNCKKDGILVRAEEKKGKMDINFVQPIHTLCVGTTSSGKTSRFVVPTLQLMSMTAAKPSFVVTDPKGELYDKCALKMQKEGYDVKVVNMRNAFTSVQWNPLTYPYDMYHRSFSLEKEVKVHRPGDNPKQYNLILQRPFDYNASVWFEFNGVAYADKSSLESDMHMLAMKLQDDTYTAINDICVTLAPVQNSKDPSWEQTAQKLIQAVILAMLEDSRDSRLGLTREKFNMYNVTKICNTVDSGRDTYATLKKYLFEYRDKFSKVGELANTALMNAESTTKNYMGFVSKALSLFSDTGICLLTALTEVNFVEMDKRPTVIFLIIPDEIRTRYPLAILFVNQLYKRLVEHAEKQGGELKRHVYFLLDEFGNMPRFPDFGSSMAVGRSRGIFFELVVQSYSQLYQIYGQDEGKIIKDNCPIQVYIASEDTTTNKEFSELLGKKTIVLTNTNKSKGPDGKETTSTSESVQSIPIAYPEELPSYRDKGMLVIKTFTPNAALRTKITSCYHSKVYEINRMYGTYTASKIFEEDKFFYDIKERNKIVAGTSEDDDGDDDDLF